MKSELTETARARVAKLVENWNWPEPAILEDILALGAEAVPAIAERLTPEFFKKVRTEDPENTQVFYFLHLLGETGDPAAIPLLFNLYGEIEQEDDLLEDIPGALEKLGPQAVGPLLRVAADESLGWFPRVAAAEAAKNVAAADPVLQKQVAEGLRAILTGYLTQTAPPDDDARDVIASICADLASLADAEAHPLIEAAFDAGIVGHVPTGKWAMDIPIIDREGVAYLYDEGGQIEVRTPWPFMERYRRDYRKHEEEEARKATLAVLEAEVPPQPVVLSPRLGRNDPCWCGSGKKYKKCHLAQDEKEKSRL